MNRITYNEKLFAYNIKKLDEFPMLYSDHVVCNFIISFYEIRYVPKWRFLFIKSHKKVKKIIPLGLSKGSFEANVPMNEFTIKDKETHFVIPIIRNFLFSAEIKKSVRKYI